jgi:hypothetical protein
MPIIDRLVEEFEILLARRTKKSVATFFEDFQTAVRAHADGGVVDWLLSQFKAQVATHERKTVATFIEDFRKVISDHVSLLKMPS